MRLGFGFTPWESVRRMHAQNLRDMIEYCQRTGDRYYGNQGGWPLVDTQSDQFREMCRRFDVDPDGWCPVVT